jgi:glycosyltransferase involved in cell wall biosynthesis
MKVSVVIPAYNEKDNLRRGCLEKVRQYLTDKQPGWEVIIVDDGSTDGSREDLQKIVAKNHWRLINRPHQGKAAAVAAGVLQAKHPYTLFTDFDQATPIAEAEKLLPFVAKGYPIVIGSREVKGSLRQKEPFYRHLMGKIFNWLVQLIAVPGIHDTQCGFKIFKTETARELFNHLKVYQPRPEKYAFTGAFDVELLYLAGKRKIKIAEVPIIWTHAATTRVNPLRDSVRMFWHVVKIRLYD